MTYLSYNYIIKSRKMERKVRSMSKMTPKRQKILTVTILLALAFLVLAIIFKDKFDVFFDIVSDKISVLNSLMVGAVIAYLLNPIEKFFHNRVFKKTKSYKTKKALSIISTYVFIFGVMTAFVLFTVPQVIESVLDLPGQLKVFGEILVEKVTVWYEAFKQSEYYEALLETIGKDEFNFNDIIDYITKTFIPNVDGLMQKAADYVLLFLSKMYTGITDTFFGLVFSIYLLASKDKLKAQAKKLITAICGEQRADGILEVAGYTDHTFGGFIQGKLVNAVIISILTFLAFWIFGIPYPQLLAIIIGVTDIIPVFGPFIGAIPSAFIVLIAAPEKLIPMLLIILIIQQIDGNYIGPKILGESTGLSALGVFVAIIVMGGYFGIVGMLIGVPTFAVAQYFITRAVDKKLTERGISTDLADYYTDSSSADYEGNAIRKNLFTRIVDPMIKFITTIFSKIVGFFKKMPKIKKKAKKKKKSNDTEN